MIRRTRARAARSARRDLGDQQQPEHAKDRPAVVSEDRQPPRRRGRGRRETSSRATRAPAARARHEPLRQRRQTPARVTAARRTASCTVSARAATRAERRGAGTEDACVVVRPASMTGHDHRASTPWIACSDTCAVSSACVGVAGCEVGQGGEEDQRCVAALGEAPELAQGSLALALVVTGDDQLAAQQVGVDRLEDAASAADPADGRGQHPRDVRGARQRDLVGLAGERAAVDHGQRVALASVVEQQLDPLARALGREPRAGREHAHARRWWWRSAVRLAARRPGARPPLPATRGASTPA